VASLKEKSISGVIWDLVGRLALQGIGFFISIILARILSPDDFGLIAIIAVFINLASTFLDFGFSTALVQRKDVNETHYGTVFYLNVFIGTLLAIITFFSAPFFAAFYSKPILTDLLRVMSISFFVNAFGNVWRAYLRREMNFKATSVSSIIGSFLSGIVAISMAFAGFGVWCLVILSISGQLFSTLVLFIGWKVPTHMKFNFSALKDLWGFSSKMFFSGLLDSIFFNFDALIIGKTSSTASLGYYYRAKSLENFSFRYTAITLTNVLLPGLSSIQNDTETLKNVVIKIFKILSIISFFGCGVLLISARELIILLFSNKWEPSVLMFQILIVGAIAAQIFSLVYNVLLGTGHVKIYFLINMLSKIVLFINFFSLIFFGLTNYLVFLSVIQILIFLTGLFIITRLFHYRKLLWVLLLKYLSCFLLSVIVSIFIKNIISLQSLLLNFLIISVLFSLLFFLGTKLFRCEGIHYILVEVIIPLKNAILLALKKKNQNENI
jgi:O-antigen/teichoic acid export membrane protein